MQQNRASKRTPFFQCLSYRRDGRGIIIRPPKSQRCSSVSGKAHELLAGDCGYSPGSSTKHLLFHYQTCVCHSHHSPSQNIQQIGKEQTRCNVPWSSSGTFCAVAVHMSSADLGEVFILPYFVLQKSIFHPTPTTPKTLLHYRTAWMHSNMKAFQLAAGAASRLFSFLATASERLGEINWADPHAGFAVGVEFHIALSLLLCCLFGKGVQGAFS